MKVDEKLKEVVERESQVLQGEEGRSAIYYSRKAFDYAEEAEEAYRQAVDKLFDVNGWSDIGGLTTAKFSLYDPDGKPTDHLELGCFVKVELPGPFPENWVRVNEVYEEDFVAEFKVHPSHSPLNKEHQEVVDHFFTSDASSSFRVTLKEKLLSAYEIGRDEYINNRDEESGDRKVTNTLISEGGWMAFQKIQWQSLTDYLVGES
ncbi:hypothetical protein RCC89_02805 [Cytophagaceae bacterium ABcell3]|nr:hypothetical protein RCC89_02805 [Cytophagaceae bacterium ABcell3]